MGAGRKGLGDINYLAHARPQQLYSVTPLDRAAWTWESLVWQVAGALDSPQLDEVEAQALLADLWERHRHLGRPIYQRPPRLIADPDYPGCGLAHSTDHWILVRADQCRLPVLLHEMGHLLVPGSGHGLVWIQIMLQLWEIELNVPRSVALLAGRQLLVA
jgi:hypothetical protein